MNITEQIIGFLESIGYYGGVSTVVRYFIEENIKGIYGTTYMNSNDYSLSLEDDSIDLKSIFKEGRYIISVNFDRDLGTTTLKCDRVVKNEIKRAFEITDSESATTNRFYSEDGTQKELSFDKTNNIFSLQISHEEENQQVLDYKGSLTPIYSKTGDTDWFTYSREMPPMTKEKSLLKRIADELSNRGCSRQIVTSSDGTIGYEEFPINIFGVLLQEASMETQSKGKSEKKRIRN